MFLIYVCIFLLKIMYFFIKFLPVQTNKIVFISRQSDKTSLDFRLMIDDLNRRYPDYKIKVITKRIEKNYKDVLLKNTTLIFSQMFHLATSKICVIDGYNIAVSVLNHKKSLKVFQIWHSLGAIKMFGCQTLNTEKSKKFAKILKMHQGYDYILSASEPMNQYYAKAFNSINAKFYNMPLPRVDYLINNKKKLRNEILKAYPKLKNKTNILYAPTFRNNNHYEIDKLIEKIDFNKYNLIIKLHPCMKCGDYNKYNISKYSAFSLLTIADYVITDYSGFLLESLIINKPVYIYAYDYQDYIKSNGLNINLKEEFKDFFYEDINELYESINNHKYNISKLNTLRKRYITDTSGKSTEKVVNFIIKNGGLNEKIKNYNTKFFKETPYYSYIFEENIIFKK